MWKQFISQNQWLHPCRWKGRRDSIQLLHYTAQQIPIFMGMRKDYQQIKAHLCWLSSLCCRRAATLLGWHVIGQLDDFCYCSLGICVNHIFHNPYDREDQIRVTWYWSTGANFMIWKEKNHEWQNCFVWTQHASWECQPGRLSFVFVCWQINIRNKLGDQPTPVVEGPNEEASAKLDGWYDHN